MSSLVKPSNNYLSLEVFLIGGFSILTCMFAWMFIDKSSTLYTISNFAFSLAFVANHPHFLSSYQLIYSDFSSNIFKRKRFFFTAVLVPLTLLAVLGWALVEIEKSLMSQMISVMFFLVGWHYVKQIFGCIIVSSAQRKIYYNKTERYIFLCNLFSIWFLSFLGANVGEHKYVFYGISYQSFNLPTWILLIDQIVFGISLLVILFLQVRKYILFGTLPHAPAVVAFFSIYVWYLPLFSHPGFGYLIPFFHSIQYLGFVWVYKWNRFSSENRNLNGVEWRKQYLRKFIGFFVGSITFGALCFEIVPKLLDKMNFIPKNSLGEAPFLAAFIIFINVHHYFIDNTIWRSDNPEINTFLMQEVKTLPT